MASKRPLGALTRLTKITKKPEVLLGKDNIVFFMTKVISLSEKAYQTLKGMKKSGESFSDVVIRVTSKEKKKSILEFAGTWKGDDADEVLAQIMKDRERVKPRELEI